MLTSEGFVSSVEDHVSLQSGGSVKHFATNIACCVARHRVSLDVRVQTGLVEECFVTLLHWTREVGRHLQLVSLACV